MASRPKVSVIVPHFQDLDGLDRCLDALGRQTYPAGDFEILVADNASPAGETAVAARIAGRARLVVVAEKGAGPARNGGVAASLGETLAFTDSDCVPEPAWLGEGLAALAAFDLVGGRMRVLVGDEACMTGTEAFEAVFAFDNETYVTRKGFTVTANLFCRRAVFEAVGGFRVGVSEDLEWGLRARERGFRIGYAAGAVAGHPARRTWPELTRKWERLSAETFGLVAATPGGRTRWLLRALALPPSALAHTPRVLQSRALHSWRDRGLALAVLYRLRWWRFVDALRLLAG
jgi:GT2 family glycosyltransferase